MVNFCDIDLLLTITGNIRVSFQISALNSLPNNKILDLSILKAIADDIINVDEMRISLSDSVEDILRKGENTGYQHFLLFPQCFLLYQRQKYNFGCLICHLQMLSIWSHPKFHRLGMG